MGYVKTVAAFDDFAVKTVDGGADTLNCKPGVIDKGGITIGHLVVRGEGIVIIEHNLGRAGVRTALVGTPPKGYTRSAPLPKVPAYRAQKQPLR